jgi:hypothetical protein
MSNQVGQTVMAIRDGDEKTLNVYGEGVYVGDRLMPGLPEEPSEEERAEIEAGLRTNDAVPVLEHQGVRMVEAQIGSLRVPPEARDEVIAGIEAERARPMEERIAFWYHSLNENPCIYLDNGDIVWGFQCWWGPKDATLTRFPDAEIITVVPEGNGRWR